MDRSEIQQLARRVLADYDAGRANEVFAARGTAGMSLDDAYGVQQAVAGLRKMRGERAIGYKVGCISPTIQQQFGLTEPVRGYIWGSEMLVSGSSLSHSPTRPGRFVNLAIEGEIALRLGRDVAPGASGNDLAAAVEAWFPVIELHNFVFRAASPTSQELVAGNAMHAGIVVPSSAETRSLASLSKAEIRVEIDGKVEETKSVSEIPGGPLGTLAWLAASLASSRDSLKAGDFVLAGSPGRLIPVSEHRRIAAICQGQRVELLIASGPAA